MGRTNKMRISVISIILGILLIAFIGVATIVTNNQSQIAFAEPAEPHDHSGWTEWSATDSLPTEGNYYLTDNVTVSEQTIVQDGNVVNLCLNGYSVTNTVSRIYLVNNGGTLHVYDDVGSGSMRGEKLNNNYDNSIGTVVRVAAGGYFELHGGTLYGSSTPGKGYFTVLTNGEFVMSGGMITEENDQFGVQAEGANSVFRMTGGTITNCKGGGVHVYGGTAYISGGTISNNGEARAFGGVLLLSDYATSKLFLSGNPTIANNTNNQGVDCNVNLYGTKTITIDGALTNTTPIGVTRAIGTFTSGWPTYMGEADPAGYFTSDNDNYAVAKGADGEAQLAEKVVSVTVGETVTYYDNVSDALSAWGDGSTLTLLKDVIGQVTVTSGTKTLDLNNHSITYSSGSVIIVSGGLLTICDNSENKTVHYYLPNQNGVATLSATKTDYYFEGGYVTGGVATLARGGGLRVLGTGSVVFGGGTLFANSAGWGGGLWSSENSSVTIEGTAAIIGNYSSGNYTSGGGIFMEGSSAVTMTGGSIRHNSAQWSGGGVRDCVSENTGVRFTMTGGEITGNYAKNNQGNGFCFDAATTFNIGGTARIFGNQGTNDIYFYNDRYLTVVAPFEEGALIGVTLQGGTGTFTSGWSAYMEDAEPADYFTSNDAQYAIGLGNGEAALLLPMTAEAEGYEGDYDGDAHGITVTPSVTGTTIKYGASADACTFDTLTYANAGMHTIYYEVKKTGYATVKGSATVTISAINLTITITGHNDTVEYDGTKHSVTGFDVADGTGLYKESDLAFSGTAVAEQTNAGTAYMGLEASQFANTNGNFATVTFTVTDGYVTVLTVDAVVSKAPQTVDPVYDGEEKVLIVAGVADGGTIYYALGNAEVAPTEGYKEDLPVATEIGNYYVWYKVVGDNNHNDLAPAFVKVTIAEPAWVTLSGAVTDGTANIDGAVVKLMKGNKLVDFVTTDGGAYRFIVAPGVYNIVVEYDNHSETTIVMLFENVEKDVVLSDTKTESKLEVKTEEEEDLGIAVGGLEEEAQAIREENPNAETVSVVMTVEYKSEEQIEEEPEEAPAKNIQNSAQEKNLEFYEIKVEKTVDQATTILEETANILEIAIPYEKINKRGLSVYSYHDASVRTFTESDTKADGTFRVDKANKLIYVYANKFSTYAVGYTPYYRVQTALSLGSYTGKASVTIVSDADENVKFTLKDADLNNIVFPDVPKGQYTMTVTWGAGSKNTMTMTLTVGAKTVLSLKTEPEEPEEEPAAPANAAYIDMPEETELVAGDEEDATVVMVGIGYEMDAPDVAITEEERKKEEIRALLRKRDDYNE